MKLTLDENFGERGRAQLTAAGHDVATAAGQQLEGAKDKGLIEVCRCEGRALVTLDLNFANPVEFRPANYPGIAVLHLPQNPAPEDLKHCIDTLAKGLEHNPLTGKLWIVEPGRVRVYEPTG